MRRSIYPILVFAAVAVVVPLAGRLGVASGWVSKPWMGRLVSGDDPSAAPKAAGVRPASADGATPSDKLADAQPGASTGVSRGVASGGGSTGASAAPGAVGAGSAGASGLGMAPGTGTSPRTGTGNDNDNGTGNGNATGTGTGNGTGTGSGNGNGNGNGTGAGTGNGTGAGNGAGVGKATAPGGGSKAVAKSGSGSEHGATQTAEERKAALDQRLNASLDSFDAKLRLEQQKTAQARDARQTAVATLPASGENSGSGSDGQSGGDRSAQGGDGGGSRHTHGAGSDDSHGGDLKSDQASRRASVAGNGAVATEMPDGNDDDVVARRLRKAAEQETDPELKDKLWNEYVEYKKNVQAK